MFAIASLLALVSQVSGTPYIPGGDSPAGTDCSGLASWISNVATDRPVYGNRFQTANEERALLERGFRYGTQPGALVIGWNSSHTAVTLPDGTPVSSGEGGRGVRVGGDGAYQPRFNHHMYLPMTPDVEPVGADTPADPPPPAVLPIEVSPPPPTDLPAPSPMELNLPAPADGPPQATGPAAPDGVPV